MKILQLCLRVPYPAADGGAIAMNNLAEALVSAGASVTMRCINTQKHFTEIESLPEIFSNKFNPKAVFVDTRVKVIPALLNLFDDKSYNVERFDSPAFHKLLAETLDAGKFDAIIAESIFMAPYLETVRKHTDAPVFLRAHNVEYIIWKRLASNAKPVLKQYLNFLAGRLQQYEKNTINKFDGIIAISDMDAQLFKSLGCQKPVHIAPISVNANLYSDNNVASDAITAFHLGSMDWLPNQEGVTWFLDKVYPLIKDIDGLKIVLAGKGMTDEYFSRAAPNLEVIGKVEDARQFMRDKQIMLVPLLSGGGMRVKIIEGLAAGKTIITTSTGAEGVLYEDGKNILIADDPKQFAEKIRQCVSNPEFCVAVGIAARQLINTTYDNTVIGKQVFRFINSFLEKIPSAT